MPRGSKKQGKGPPDQSKGACCQYFDPATRTLCLQGFETRRAFREHALRAHGGGNGVELRLCDPLAPGRPGAPLGKPQEEPAQWTPAQAAAEEGRAREGARGASSTCSSQGAGRVGGGAEAAG